MRTQWAFKPGAGLIASALMFVSFCAHAIPITSDFEAYSDQEVLTTQISGMTFEGAMVLQSGALGGSLNEFDFPPRSGGNVLFASDGPLLIVFTEAMGSFSAYFTYSEQVTMLAYGADLQLLGSVSSLSSANFVSAGGIGNELLTLAGLGPFSRVVFSVDSVFGSFVLDDLAATSYADIHTVPEPNMLLLLAIGSLLCVLAREFTRKNVG
jgi:hypothetical protein